MQKRFNVEIVDDDALKFSKILDIKSKVKLQRRFELLEEFGPLLMRFVEKAGKYCYELKVPCRSGNVRFFYFFYTGRRIIVIHHISHKDYNKLRPKDIKMIEKKILMAQPSG